MKTSLEWQDNMTFLAHADSHSIVIDAKPPIGKNSGPTPKELVAIGLGGCTAMDVVALLKKYKQVVESFTVEVDITPTSSGHPVQFQDAALLFRLKGAIEPDKLLEAVKLSQTKFCGVSSMLVKAIPITYKVELNGEIIGSGEAAF